MQGLPVPGCPCAGEAGAAVAWILAALSSSFLLSWGLHLCSRHSLLSPFANGPQ